MNYRRTTNTSQSMFEIEVNFTICFHFGKVYVYRSLTTIKCFSILSSSQSSNTISAGCSPEKVNVISIGCRTSFG